MKATALIEQQHREVEGLFETIQTRPTPKSIEQLATTIIAHAVMEEQIFYPVAAKSKRDLVLESYEEHEILAFALKRLVGCDPKDEAFPARLKAVKHVFTQHIQEEEQEMLPAAAQDVPEEEQETLGRQMKARFDEVHAGGYEGALAARRSKRSSNGGHAKGTTSTSKKKTGQTTSHRKAA